MAATEERLARWTTAGGGGSIEPPSRCGAAARPSVETGLHRTRVPRAGAADERQGSGLGERAMRDRARGRLFLIAGRRNDGFASHRTTFLTGSGADHRVKRPPDECIMS